MSEIEVRPAPTKGLRVEVEVDKADRDHGDITFLTVRQYAVGAYVSTPAEANQAKVDAAYINWLIETDEKRREHLAKQSAGAQDILVDMGDMTRVNLDNIALDQDYESMTEDIIQNVNHIILQGIEPIKALFSMSQAFAIVLGYALRANMPFAVAKALVTQVMKSATASEQMIRIITKQ